jgi:quinol monooxygenase YgiN
VPLDDPCCPASYREAIRGDFRPELQSYQVTNERRLIVVIVSGHIVVDPQHRDHYLSGCVEVVRQARAASGCLDFAISPDLLEPGRINIFERWESQAAVEAFRGSGPGDEQGAAIQAGSVAEYDVGGQRNLF